MARSSMSPLPKGDQASRILSEPPNTRTPCSRRSFIGGMVAPPGPWLMMATPVSAKRSAVRAACSVGTEPNAKAWLTATLPRRPAASVRSAIALICARPPSPPSCRWMSMPTPRRSAMAKIGSRWPSRSPSMPTGSSPPTRSAPSAMAASSSAAVPGERRMPLCGKATIWMVTRSRKRSRTVRISWRFLRPSWLSMSTWLRMCSVPLATTWRTRLAPVFDSGTVRAARTLRSASMRSATRLPVAWLGTQGRPRSVLSRWIWPSTSGGRTSAPPRSRSPPWEAGRRAAIRPPRTSMSCLLPSGSVALASRTPLLVGDGARFLAGLCHGSTRSHCHQARIVGDGHEMEAHADRPRGVACRAVVDAGEQAALLGGGDELLVDFQDLRLLAVELGHQAERQAEIARADIDAADARHLADGVDVVDRLLGLDHGNDQHFVVGRRLVGRGRAVGAGADRAVAALALGRIERIGDQRLGFGDVVHHRADHAPGAAVQDLADDAGLVPWHAHQRCHRMLVHRLEAGDHRMIVLHAVLHVEGDAVPAALRHGLGREAAGDGEPCVDAGLALFEALFQRVGRVHDGVSSFKRERRRPDHRQAGGVRPWCPVAVRAHCLPDREPPARPLIMNEA